MYKKIFEDYKKAKLEYETSLDLLKKDLNKFEHLFWERIEEIINLIKKKFPIKTEKTYSVELKENGVFVKGDFFNLSEIFIPEKYLSMSDEEINEELKNEIFEVFENKYKTT